MRRVVTGLAASALVVASLTGCGGDKSTSTLTIFAASSLTSTFTTLQAQFEKEHPDVKVVISFGSSTTLAEQITAGAPADVIATADQASISDPQQAGDLAATPVQFATNVLVIAVPPSNPGKVSGVDSLNTVDFVACEVSAPCGAAAATMLTNAGITGKPKAYFPDVATVLTQIEQDNADAGIVYVTDALSAGSKVTAIQIPATDNVTNDYFIAPVKDSKESTLANDWVTLVTSQGGQSVLQKAGFGAP